MKVIPFKDVHQFFHMFCLGAYEDEYRLLNLVDDRNNLYFTGSHGQTFIFDRFRNKEVKLVDDGFLLFNDTTRFILYPVVKISPHNSSAIVWKKFLEKAIEKPDDEI